jgi:hypothetical protein
LLITQTTEPGVTSCGVFKAAARAVNNGRGQVELKSVIVLVEALNAAEKSFTVVVTMGAFALVPKNVLLHWSQFTS